jgi:dsDNA-specific endonuclease/ATPase MutS2
MNNSIEDPIDGTLDLHAFDPRDLDELLPVYIEECLDQGIYSLRIVHGKGRGVQRRRVHAILRRLPEVASFEPGGMGGGQWGATLVTLIKKGATD